MGRHANCDCYFLFGWDTAGGMVVDRYYLSACKVDE